MNRYKETIPTILLIGAVLSFASILSSPNLLANDTIIDNIEIDVPASCSLSGTGQTSHNAEIQNGQYNSSIGETTLKAFCNDSEGFAIYAVGFTDNSFGKNVLTNSTLGSTYDIVTGTATSGTTSNWAMKLSTISSPTPTYPITIQNSYGSFHNVPSTYELVASRSSGTDIGQSAEGSTLKTTYQAYISGTQAAGTYTGQVKYTLVHPATETPTHPETTQSSKICYYPNGSNVVGSMGCQNVASSVTLLASNFSRQGYGFAGWNTAYDYTGTFYGPQETITLTTADYSSPNNGLSLYAVWVKSQGSLQDSSKVTQLCGTNGTGGTLITAPTNGTANLSSVSALTDQRDNETYAIAKLADGKCWMIENLRLESTASHNTDGTLAQGYHSSFAGLATAESANFENSTTANSLYSTDGSTAKTIDSTGGNRGYRFPRYNNYNHQVLSENRPQNPTTNSATNPTSNAGMYSYGNYYTWHAAIADTTHNGTNNTSSDTTSICPTGWHLPKGGNKSNEANNEFWSLVVTGINNGTNPANYESSTQPYYTGTPEGVNASNALRAYPNNFLYSGYFNTSSASSYRGSRGYYWSSTALTHSLSYYLNLYSSSVYPGTYNFDKSYGLSVRCLASS